MIPYVLSFIWSTLFAFLANRCIGKSKPIFFVFSILSISSVALLAGLRDPNIGTDVLVYGNEVFELSKKFPSFISFYKSVSDINRLEPVYMLINYFCGKISENVWLFYTVLSLITQGLFYISIFRMRIFLSPILSWFSYLLIFYGATLNMMRQSLAMGFILLAFTYLIEKKYMTSFSLIIISFLCHYSSGIVGLFIYLIFLFISNVKRPKYLMFIFIVFSIFLLVFFRQLSTLLVTIGILPVKYSMYLEDSQGAGFSVLSILLKVPVILLSLWQFTNVKKSKIGIFFMLMISFDFLFYQLRIYSFVFSRISYYFGIFQVISVPFYMKRISSNVDKKVIKVLYVVYLIIVWYYQIVVTRNNQIYPYTSEIINSWRLF